MPFLDMELQSLKVWEDRMEKVPISSGKVGETFLTVGGKRVQIMQKNANNIRIVVMATRREIDVDPDYIVIPPGNGTSPAKLTEVASTKNAKEKREVQMKDKNSLRVEAISDDDELDAAPDDEEDEFLDDEEEDEAAEEEEDDEVEEADEEEDEEEETEDEALTDDDEEEASEDDAEEAESDDDDEEDSVGEEDEEDDEEDSNTGDEEDDEDGAEESDDDSADDESDDDDNEDTDEDDAEPELDAATFATKEEVEAMGKRISKVEAMLAGMRKPQKVAPSKKEAVAAAPARRGRPPKIRTTEKVPEKVRKEIEKSAKPKKVKEAKVKVKEPVHAKEGGERKHSRQIGLVVKLLTRKAQTRDTLAAAIREAGLGKDKDDKDIKNYISVMLNKLKTMYEITSPKRGVYRITGEKTAE